jgi:hypothetical protein
MDGSVAAALNNLQHVLDKGIYQVCYRQPTMQPEYGADHAIDLFSSMQHALGCGADVGRVFQMVYPNVIRDVEQLPWRFEKLLIDHGLSPDTDFGGETLLHRLLQEPRPPVVRQLQHNGSRLSAYLRKPIPLDKESEHDLGVTLDELLIRKPTPDMRDANGNTALHMAVACMVERVHYPDSSADQVPPLNGSFHNGDLEDHDAERAEYLTAAFHMLLEAGWSVDVRNNRGHTVVDLLAAGLDKYQAELAELSDPAGPAQRAVAQLSVRAPNGHLVEFLEDKMEAMARATATLQQLHDLAVSRARPKQVRSAAVLVGVWVLLVAIVLGWLMNRW